eukprot:gb/GECG01012163.1/.p1 GENE.gb/GECG01012163.1/~~gb/GECG01012163.1/.p1  ORF type:complete len:179 (+),score=6.03 gb/GECG01012163.1/:1-537(+)
MAGLVLDARNTLEEDNAFEFDSIFLFPNVARWPQHLLQDLMEFLHIQSVDIPFLVLILCGSIIGRSVQWKTCMESNRRTLESLDDVSKALQLSLSTPYSLHTNRDECCSTYLFYSTQPKYVMRCCSPYVQGSLPVFSEGHSLLRWGTPWTIPGARPICFRLFVRAPSLRLNLWCIGAK